MDKKQVLDEREALLEMYKAGFLDGYTRHKKVKTDDDFKLLNKYYKMSFVKRFEKRINSELKKMKGGKAK